MVSKADIIELKKKSVKELKKMGKNINSLHLNSDPRLDDYLQLICKAPELHNVYELLAVLRFISFVKKYDFRGNIVSAYVDGIEALKYKGSSGMEFITLSPVQVFFLAGVYGFYKEDGRRLTHNAFLFVPRKFGKTMLVSGIATLELLTGESDGQIFVCANSYKQAKVCFDNIRATLKTLDANGKDFKVNREIIYNQMPGRHNYAQCLAADPSTLDGLNASLYILDEYSQAKTPELRNVMASSQGTRINPLEIIITTASSLPESPCASTLDAYRSILMGTMEDDSVFALLFQPDVDDDENDESVWKKVQPHLGVTIQPDYYREWAVKAQQSPSDLLTFRTKMLNIFATNNEKTWIDEENVKALFKPFDFDALDTKRPPYCCVAMDLSVWDDFSCITYAVFNATTKSFHFHLDYYIPEGSINKHMYSELYRRWVDQGYLIALPGDTISYEAIVNDILKRNSKVRIVAIGYDPYKASTAVNMLSAAGATNVLKAIKQTNGAFNAGVEITEMIIKSRKCTFSPNPITPYCFCNCVIDEDRMGNRKPQKKTANLKIDGAITVVMCVILYLMLNSK